MLSSSTWFERGNLVLSQAHHRCGAASLSCSSVTARSQVTVASPASNRRRKDLWEFETVLCQWLEGLSNLLDGSGLLSSRWLGVESSCCRFCSDSAGGPLVNPLAFWFSPLMFVRSRSAGHEVLDHGRHRLECQYGRHGRHRLLLQPLNISASRAERGRRSGFWSKVAMDVPLRGSNQSNGLLTRKTSLYCVAWIHFSDFSVSTTCYNY